MKKILFVPSLFLAFLVKSQTNVLPSSGNAGIGTSAPSVPFEIGTTLTQGATIFKFGNGQQPNQIIFKDRDYAHFMFGVQANQLKISLPGFDHKIMSTMSNSNNIEFWPNISINTPNNIMLNGQFVGIGTSNPQYKMDVLGDIYTSANLFAGTTFTINGASGSMRNSAWNGVSKRILIVDTNGNLSPLSAGSQSQVLYGDGSWGNLPSALTSFTANGNTLYLANSTSLGIGTPNPQYLLDVAGDARVSNNLYVGGGIVITDNLHASESVTATVLKADSIKMDTSRAIYGSTRIEGDIDAKNKLTVSGNATFGGAFKLSSLASSGGDQLLYIDSYGNLKTGTGGNNGQVNNTPCVPGSLPWYQGGNYAPANNEIGTCDITEFIVKTNNIKRTWFQNDGTISFGAKIVSNTNGPEYKFHQGALRLSGNNTFGGPQIIFDGGSTYGDWGIEYAANSLTKPGLNFWKPFGSANSFNYKLFLADDGTIGMGTDNPQSRLTLDAWSGDGLKIYSGVNYSKAISLQYKNGNSFTENFLVNGDGATWIGTNVSTIGSAQLVVGQPGLQNKCLSLVNNANSSSLQQVFNVYGSGLTEIRSFGTGPTDDVLIIKDASNNDKIQFKLKKNGYAYAREINVQLTNFPDYVFSKNYKLNSLETIENYIQKYNRLPNMPSATDIEENGANLGEIQKITVEKTEELFLYVIELDKRVKALEKENMLLKQNLKKKNH